MKQKEITNLQEQMVRGGWRLYQCGGDETDLELAQLAVELTGHAWDSDPGITRRCVGQLRQAAEAAAPAALPFSGDEMLALALGCLRTALWLERRMDRNVLCTLVERLENDRERG